MARVKISKPIQLILWWIIVHVILNVIYNEVSEATYSMRYDLVRYIEPRALRIFITLGLITALKVFFFGFLLAFAQKRILCNFTHKCLKGWTVITILMFILIDLVAGLLYDIPIVYEIPNIGIIVLGVTTLTFASGQAFVLYRNKVYQPWLWIIISPSALLITLPFGGTPIAFWASLSATVTSLGMIFLIHRSPLSSGTVEWEYAPKDYVHEHITLSS